MNNHAPTVPALDSGTLTSGNTEGKRRFGLGIRFIHRILSLGDARPKELTTRADPCLFGIEKGVAPSA
ncbi:MAG: hypothetical protein LBE08_08330 [Bifidobacteriaceae bacterium]|nr:hypothetical protein [Bifidobacteriaceae bacterium]